MSQVHIAVVQCALNDNSENNVARVHELIIEAARSGAQVVLPPELFETPYFCKTQRIANFSLARPVHDHPTIAMMQRLAREYRLVLPVSFFEADGPHFYNSVAMIDADGSILGVYRKSHIPDGPGYQEKYYFRPGDTGLKVWSTRYGRLGVGICWDQWFPEVARELTLLGAQALLYPSAIGTEPATPTLDTKDLWQRAMIGHAVCNVIPVAASNRIGTENDQTFYGSSFIVDHAGDKCADLGRDQAGVGHAVLDLDIAATERAAFGFFRDRRPELYPNSARLAGAVRS